MDGGGGFLNYADNYNDGGNNTSSSQPSRERIWSARSLMIGQLQSAHEPQVDGPTVIDNAPLGHIRLVGQVRDIQTRSTYVIYTLDDVTGVTDVQMFVNGEAPEIEIGKYANVYGFLRMVGTRRIFSVHTISQNVSIEYVLHHEMQALREHLHYTGAKPLHGKAGEELGQVSNGNDYLQSDGDFSERVLALVPTDEPGVGSADIAHTLGVDEQTVSNVLAVLEENSQIWKNSADTFLLST